MNVLELPDARIVIERDKDIEQDLVSLLPKFEHLISLGYLDGGNWSLHN